MSKHAGMHKTSARLLDTADEETASALAALPSSSSWPNAPVFAVTARPGSSDEVISAAVPRGGPGGQSQPFVYWPDAPCQRAISSRLWSRTKSMWRPARRVAPYYSGLGHDANRPCLRRLT